MRVVAAGCLVAGATVAGFSLVAADPAGASPSTSPASSTSFTTAGCSAWDVPTGVTSVGIVAVGAAGAAGTLDYGLPGGSGGTGDEVTSTLSGLSSGQALDVCVDVGGGSTQGSGTGGGASGVSLGSTFASPVVVAAGGGGGGNAGIDQPGGGSGGSAGSSSGDPGVTVPGYQFYVPADTGGGGGTQSAFGTGGTSSGGNGGALDAAGPGAGGVGGEYYYGGGGGAGYNGGGGGGGGEAGGAGGGGGSDFCGSGADIAACAYFHAGTGTIAGGAPGDAQVTLTYTLPAAPSITTTPSATSVAIGTTLQDSATLTNNAALDGSGSITFNLFGPSDPTCSSTPLDTETVTGVSGSGPWGTTNGFDATTLGTYNWTASFSGDGNNLSASEGCGTEPVAVGQAVPSMSTTVLDGLTQTPWTGTEVTGADTSDTATVNGVAGIVPTGTVSFYWYPNSTCTGSDLGGKAASLDINGVTQNWGFFGPVGAGAYAFLAVYTGDANYQSVSTCEPFSVGMATPSLATVVDDGATGSPWAGTEGAKATAEDAATLANYNGGVLPTGTVTYSLFNGHACSGTPATTQVVTVGANVPNSSPTAKLAVGPYAFRASYSGDSNYNVATSPCEPFTVSPVNVLHVSPNTGPHTGGTKITITGTGFAPGAVVKLGQGHGAGPGSLTASKVTVVSSGKITAVTPKGVKGAWNVFVIEPGSVQSPPHPADRFTYT